jgi:hypothetical protein
MKDFCSKTKACNDRTPSRGTPKLFTVKCNKNWINKREQLYNSANYPLTSTSTCRLRVSIGLVFSAGCLQLLILLKR